MPQREQHPFSLPDFGSYELFERFERFDVFGGWVGVVLPKFFIYRFITTDRPAPRLTDGRIPRTRTGARGRRSRWG
ncbi:hypothetical protein [Streptomyces sp. NBC_00984]|uniref:hypothetical protein n=1 Tax=Streptomyces sp. NBC_00984 TaxID=2903700 RepID=UPI00386F19F8